MGQRVGQFIVSGISGKVLTKEEKHFLEKNALGGVLLFSRNFDGPAQLAELANEIQSCRKEYPLFICVDHEGGGVIRFKRGFTQFPPMLEMAKGDSPKLVYEMGKIMAQELLCCGITTNLAPVCDVITDPKNKVIGNRSFGSTPEVVSKYVSSVVRGLQANGVMACAKHFPGHGHTHKDSHIGLPLIKKTLDELRSCEFLPFIRAVKSRVEFIMMAHLRMDSIDESLPTSLSPKAYHLLRKELRFSKIIITDDMQMGAITKNYSTEDAAVMAIEAGADMIEYRDMQEAARALKALETKKLNRDLLLAKEERIKKVKQDYLGQYAPVYIPEISKSFHQESSRTFLSDLLEKLDS